MDAPICYTLAITALTAIWWAAEAIPIPATSLIPFVLFPAFGVMTHPEAAASLGSHVILLFMGGFMIAKGLEKSELHAISYGSGHTTIRQMMRESFVLNLMTALIISTVCYRYFA